MGKSRDAQVIDALFHQAIGYQQKTDKIQKCKHVTYDERGRKVSEEEVLEPYEESTYIKPNVTAQRFWLENRLPQQWGKGSTTENDGEIAFPAVEEG